jgi:hypothetical protein
MKDIQAAVAYSSAFWGVFVPGAESGKFFLGQLFAHHYTEFTFNIVTPAPAVDITARDNAERKWSRATKGLARYMSEPVHTFAELVCRDCCTFDRWRELRF